MPVTPPPTSVSRNKLSSRLPLTGHSTVAEVARALYGPKFAKHLAIYQAIRPGLKEMPKGHLPDFSLVLTTKERPFIIRYLRKVKRKLWKFI